MVNFKIVGECDLIRSTLIKLGCEYKAPEKAWYCYDRGDTDFIIKVSRNVGANIMVLEQEYDQDCPWSVTSEFYE